jgi:hypothetical protein
VICSCQGRLWGLICDHATPAKAVPARLESGAMITIARLRSLEDERFHSVLDVALDIRGELNFYAETIQIPLMRKCGAL